MPEPNLTESTVVLNLELGRIVNRRKLDRDTTAIETTIDRESLHVGVDLFDADELRACQNFLYAIKAEVRRYTVPSFLRGGMYLVKVEGVEKIEEMLQQAVTDFEPLVNAFAEVSDARRDESEARLGPAFDPGMYPTPAQIRSVYRIKWGWLTLSTPSSLKRISKALFDQEKHKAEEALQSAIEDITKMLALEARKLADHLVERLTPGEDGKSKTFRNSATSNIVEFLSTFNMRNIGTSDELEQQVARMSQLLDGVSPEDLRKSDKLREDTAKSFAGLSAALDKLVINKPARKMNLKKKGA